MTDPAPPRRRRRRAFDWSTAIIAILAFAAAATVYVRDGREHFLAILFGDLTLFAEMLPKVLAGCLIGAFVTLLLPREMVARWVGHESGFTGLLIAAFFGFLLPGGPITIYPVAGAFLVMGADAGAVVAFIVSWTLIGYTRALVWELPFFGSDFVIWRIVEALPLPIIAGLLARIAVRAGFEYREGTTMTFAINVLLWLVVGVLAFIAAMRGRVLLNDGARAGVMEFILLLPRIGIGVVGSGFVAEALPNEWIAPWLGPESGFFGVAHRHAWRRAHTGRAGRWVLDRRCRTKKRCRRAPGYRLFHCLGICTPSIGS